MNDTLTAAKTHLDNATLDMLERRARELMPHGKGGSTLALIADLRATRHALLAYLRAHGNVNRLDHDMCEVEMFKAFLHGCAVLNISAQQPSEVAALLTPEDARDTTT